MKAKTNVSRSPEERVQMRGLVKQKNASLTFMQSSGVPCVRDFKTSL